MSTTKELIPINILFVFVDKPKPPPINGLRLNVGSASLLIQKEGQKAGVEMFVPGINVQKIHLSADDIAKIGEQFLKLADAMR